MDTEPGANRPTGFTVVEALVALLLASLLAVLAFGTLARQRTLQADMARRGEVLAALRTARHVLGAEVRWGDSSMDAGSDTLALRAFRGVGLVCPSAVGGPDLVVRIEGVRAPDPEKDSVQVVAADGATRVFGLMRRDPAPPCPAAPEGRVERWRLTGPAPPDAVLARWFERGSYHLSGGALRYRRGDAGRQPLTPEVLRTPPSGFAERAGRLTLELLPTGRVAQPVRTFTLGTLPVPEGRP